jgi:hypothetical protein
MHLVVIATGVLVGAWALIALRRSLPRGRYLVFGTASGAALFGCAALAGEVGFLPPAAWFTLVMTALIALAAIAGRAGAPQVRSA